MSSWHRRKISFPSEKAGRIAACFIAQEGRLAFYDYDLIAQALSKIERGHTQDLDDVREMLRRGLVEPKSLRDTYDAIEPRLYRYPAVY